MLMLRVSYRARIVTFVIICLLSITVTVVDRHSIDGAVRVMRSAFDQVSGGRNHELHFHYNVDHRNASYVDTVLFPNSSQILIARELRIQKFFELNRQSALRFVVVTASNDLHFHVAMDAIARVQKLLPGHGIIFYDLNVRAASEDDIKKINSLCDVTYRKFNFSKYPAHVRNLNFYAWKPLIVNEVLLDHPGVFWIDSSARVQSSNLSGIVDKFIQNRGILAFGSSGTKIFPVTHEGMYRHLPIPREMAMSTLMVEAGSVLYHRTREVYMNIVRWWTACALVEDCIAPYQNRFCSFNGDREFANCHRFDQAALNILLANHFQYNSSAYFYTGSPVTRIERGSEGRESLLVCSPDGGPKRSVDSRTYIHRCKIPLLCVPLLW